MEILRWDIGDATVVRVGELDATAALQGLIPDLDPAEVSRTSWLAPHFIDEVGRLKGLVQAFVVLIAGKVIIVDPASGTRSIEPRSRAGTTCIRTSLTDSRARACSRATSTM
jgi:hypothetical protein